MLIITKSDQNSCKIRKSFQANNIFNLHKYISQNPYWSHWWWNVHSHKTRKTQMLTHRINFQNVVLSFQGIRLSTNCKFDWRQGINSVAVHLIFTRSNKSASNQFLQFVHILSWSCNQTSSSVGYGLTSAIAKKGRFYL